MKKMTRYFNIPFYTLGGIRLWRDVAVREGWKVQENLVTGSFRLLDNNGVRRIRAPERQCLYALQSYFEDWEIDDTQKEITLLIGGLMHHKGSFAKMAKRLESDGLAPVTVCTSSFFASPDDNARALAKLLGRLPKNITKINFVTVGSGAFIVRKLLSSDYKWNENIKPGRVVMLAPPNQGLHILQNKTIYPFMKVLAGKAFNYMRPDMAAKMPLLPENVDFAVIALDMKKGDRAGENNTDGLVRVSETKLKGMKDFIVFHRNHLSVTYAPEVIRAVASFLKTGRFLKNRKIDKIPDTFKRIMAEDAEADAKAEKLTLKDLGVTYFKATDYSRAP